MPLSQTLFPTAPDEKSANVQETRTVERIAKKSNSSRSERNEWTGQCIQRYDKGEGEQGTYAIII